MVISEKQKREKEKEGGEPIPTRDHDQYVLIRTHTIVTILGHRGEQALMKESHTCVSYNTETL